jgi:hypothetical protein
MTFYRTTGRLFICIALTAATASWGWAYPLDGYESTGITRLEAYRLAQEGKLRARIQPPGALLKTADIELRLADRKDFTLPAVDEKFRADVKRLLVHDPQGYGIAVLDLSDRARPRYCEVRGNYRANPGSVGKVLIAQGLFQALADLYPDSIEDRLRILRTTMVTADDFIVSNHHVVPLWQPDQPKITYRRLKIGDRANLYTYLDWMLSASSNAAASMVLREVMLLNHFGRAYPVSPEAAEAFFRQTPYKERAALLVRSLQNPVTRSGLDLKKLRQGSFFTRQGKKRVGGTTSYATPAELIRWLVKLEQGLIVDEFSSREIKRLLYMTQRRIRYASSPALKDAAVYFKSGSLYKCEPEPGFECKKYHGNVLNMLNSIAIVEHPAGSPRLHYLVAVMSNVLRKNSAVVHQSLATWLHRLLERQHGTASGSQSSQ